jgi:hypothetical protein
MLQGLAHEASGKLEVREDRRLVVLMNKKKRCHECLLPTSRWEQPPGVVPVQEFCFMSELLLLRCATRLLLIPFFGDSLELLLALSVESQLG